MSSSELLIIHNDETDDNHHIDIAINPTIDHYQQHSTKSNNNNTKLNNTLNIIEILPSEIWTRHVFKYLTLHDICIVLYKVSFKLNTYLEIYDPNQVLYRKLCFFYLKGNLEKIVTNLENHTKYLNISHNSRKLQNHYELSIPSKHKFSKNSSSELRYYLKKEIIRIKQLNLPDLLNDKMKKRIINAINGNFTKLEGLFNINKYNYQKNKRIKNYDIIEEQLIDDEYFYNEDDDFEYKNNIIPNKANIDYTNMEPISPPTPPINYSKIIGFNQQEEECNDFEDVKYKNNSNEFKKLLEIKCKQKKEIKWASIYRGLMKERENIIMNKNMEKFIIYLSNSYYYDCLSIHLNEIIPKISNLINYLKHLDKFKRHTIMFFKKYDKKFLYTEKRYEYNLFGFVTKVVISYLETENNVETTKMLQNLIKYFVKESELISNFDVHKYYSLVVNIEILKQHEYFKSLLRNILK